MVPDDGPEEEVPEEKEVDVNRDIDVQEDEVLTDELPKEQRFMSTDSFQTVLEQPHRNSNGKIEQLERWCAQHNDHLYKTPTPSILEEDHSQISQQLADQLTQNNCDTVDGPWRLMVIDEALK